MSKPRTALLSVLLVYSAAASAMPVTWFFEGVTTGNVLSDFGAPCDALCQQLSAMSFSGRMTFDSEAIDFADGVGGYDPTFGDYISCSGPYGFHLAIDHYRYDSDCVNFAAAFGNDVQAYSFRVGADGPFQSANFFQCYAPGTSPLTSDQQLLTPPPGEFAGCGDPSRLQVDGAYVGARLTNIWSVPQRVPEPDALWLILAGLASLAWMHLRPRKEAL